MSRWTAPAVAVAASGWVLLLLAAPFLSVPVAGPLYAAGAFICHQIAERSFHLDGVQLPVCARCFGLYAGAACGAIAPAMRSIRRSAPQRQRRTRRSDWIVTAVAAVPTLVTFTLEWVFGWPLSNAVRAIAAVPLGAAVAFVVVSAVATVHYD